MDEENYIPFRKADLRRALGHDAAFTSSSRKQFEQLCCLLEAAIHYDYHQVLERLKDCYAPFDPDAETHTPKLAAEKGQQEAANQFFSEFTKLLQRANFTHLGRDQLMAALEHVSAFGLNL